MADNNEIITKDSIKKKKKLRTRGQKYRYFLQFLLHLIFDWLISKFTSYGTPPGVLLFFFFLLAKLLSDGCFYFFILMIWWQPFKYSRIEIIEKKVTSGAFEQSQYILR